MRVIYSRVIAFAILVFIFSISLMLFYSRKNIEENPELYDSIRLPPPVYDSGISVEQALYRRRSVREYKDIPLTINEVSQLLWAAQGITDTQRNFRTAPSAGALYPLKVYIVIGNVKEIDHGIYLYVPESHKLVKIKDGDWRNRLAEAALGQVWVGKSAADIVISGIYEITTARYGRRGIRYVYMEAGHAAQNIYLQAVSLNIGTVVVGAFKDDDVKALLHMAENEYPLYIMPVGKI